jgi:hypothetical protein
MVSTKRKDAATTTRESYGIKQGKVTKDEALKLALEAFDSMIGRKPERVEQAITAIKEALAQPEHDYKDLYEKEKRKSAMWLSKYEEVAGPAPKAIPMAQPEQEPVAYVEYIPCCTDQTCPKCKAATPPQRTWVGLTDDEIEKMGLSNYIKVVRETEAKLKEKNT